MLFHSTRHIIARLVALYTAIVGLILSNLGIMGVIVAEYLQHARTASVVSWLALCLGLYALALSYGSWKRLRWVRRYGTAFYAFKIVLVVGAMLLLSEEAGRFLPTLAAAALLLIALSVAVVAFLGGKRAREVYRFETEHQ